MDDGLMISYPFLLLGVCIVVIHLIAVQFLRDRVPKDADFMPQPLERRTPRSKQGAPAEPAEATSTSIELGKAKLPLTNGLERSKLEGTPRASTKIDVASHDQHPSSSHGRRLSTLPERLISEAQNVPSCTATDQQQDTDCESERSHYDMIIVGAGVAGAATAASLGRLHPDMRILVIERSMGEDVDKKRIIGELLQPDGVRLLKILGISDALDGVGTPVRGYEIYHNNDQISLTYPADYSAPSSKPDASEASIPPGIGFHNWQFVDGLRQIIHTLPNVTICNGTVRKVHEDPRTGRLSTVEYVPKAQKKVSDIEVAGEMHPNLPPAPSPKTVGQQSEISSTIPVLPSGSEASGALQRKASDSDEPCSGRSTTSSSPACPPRTLDEKPSTCSRQSSTEPEPRSSPSSTSAPSKSSTSLLVTGDLVVVAEGCFSTHRKLLVDDAKKDVYGYFLGMVLKDVPPSLSSRANVVLADPTPILFYPIAKNEMRILIDFPGKVPRGDALRSHLVNKVMPQLPEAVHDAFRATIARNEYRVMPNQVMSARPKVAHQSPSSSDGRHSSSKVKTTTRRQGADVDVLLEPRKTSGVGAVALGDALNMRHPMTGAGMTVALSDVAVFVSLVMQHESLSDPQDVDKIITSFYRQRAAPSATLNILACALYRVMEASNSDFPAAFFKYVGQHGFRELGPMRLLAGKSRDTNELILHFVSVAFCGISTIVGNFPTPHRLLRCYRLIYSAIQIMVPLVEHEQVSPLMRFLCWLGKVVLCVEL